MFRDIDKSIMRKFLFFSRIVRQFLSFQYFLKWFSATKLPLVAREYYAYNNVPSVEKVKLLTVIEAKMGQTGRRSKLLNAQLLLNHLCYRESYQIMI